MWAPVKSRVFSLWDVSHNVPSSFQVYWSEPSPRMATPWEAASRSPLRSQHLVCGNISEQALNKRQERMKSERGFRKYIFDILGHGALKDITDVK